MCQPGSRSPEERRLSVEQALLSEIICIPDRLTPEELILRVISERNERGSLTILVVRAADLALGPIGL